MSFRRRGEAISEVATGDYRLRGAENVWVFPPRRYQCTRAVQYQQLRKLREKDAYDSRACGRTTQYRQPEEADLFLCEAQDNRGLGRLYADAVLGVIGEPYLGNAEIGIIPLLASTAFAGEGAP